MSTAEGEPRRPPSGVATGIGSVPGDLAADAARWVVDAVPDLPHLAELPARGPWAMIAGRAAGLLVDLPVELELDRWRMASSPGRDLARVRSLLAEDLDALEESLQGYDGPLKVQVCGPVTLAASVELRAGDVLSSDPAALRDVAASLAEGVAEHLRDVARRVPGATLVLQLDEPGLAAVTSGRIPRASGWGVHAAVAEEVATGALAAVLAAAEPAAGHGGAATVVHCCDGDPDWSVLSGSTAGALSLDVTALDLRECSDRLGEWVERGGVIWAGLDVSDRDDAWGRLRDLCAMLGLAGEAAVSRLAVTPACGLPSVTVPVVRDAYAAARDLARRLSDAEGGIRQEGA